MLRFAMLQMRDAHAAEDAVQDALLLAFKNYASFAGRSGLDTWVFSILRNRIVDLLRSQAKRSAAFDPLEQTDEQLDVMFKKNAHWHKSARPMHWGEPDQILDNEQFWQVFEICMTSMKEQIARVFTMREFLGFETDEICAQLNISQSNCWTLLHRARSRLRLCLESRWFKSLQE